MKKCPTFRKIFSRDIFWLSWSWTILIVQRNFGYVLATNEFQKPSESILKSNFYRLHFLCFFICFLSQLKKKHQGAKIEVSENMIQLGWVINRAKMSPTTSGYPVISPNWTFCGPGHQSRSLQKTHQGFDLIAPLRVFVKNPKQSNP